MAARTAGMDRNEEITLPSPYVHRVSEEKNIHSYYLL